MNVGWMTGSCPESVKNNLFFCKKYFEFQTTNNQVLDRKSVKHIRPTPQLRPKKSKLVLHVVKCCDFVISSLYVGPIYFVVDITRPHVTKRVPSVML